MADGPGREGSRSHFRVHSQDTTTAAADPEAGVLDDETK